MINTHPPSWHSLCLALHPPYGIKLYEPSVFGVRSYGVSEGITKAGTTPFEYEGSFSATEPFE